MRYHKRIAKPAIGRGINRVTVVVLGDLGRSPRMVNHALALAEAGTEVWLVGYPGAPLEDAVERQPLIHVTYLQEPRKTTGRAGKALFVLLATLRFGYLHLRLLWLLMARTPRADAVLVQNPPSIPTLLIALVAARLRGSRFLVDWHNFGEAMLALRLGPRHPAVRLAGKYELVFGRLADAHFCVSEAMCEELKIRFGIRSATVLYDRPRTLAPPLAMSGRRALADRVLSAASLPPVNHRPLLICPTSWTADEDMGMLVDALAHWDRAASNPHRAGLRVLITGKGPMRQAIEQRLRAMQWSQVEIHTAFVEPGAYRDLLRAAHLGVCLHRSASGVDLPMKVVDLFGARTPVCAFDYGPCLAEQIQHGITGMLFHDAEDLARLLAELFGEWPNVSLLERLQANIAVSWRETWSETWRREAASAFLPPRHTG